MNLIPEAKINEIRDKADIVDIISGYIPLVNKGRNFFGVCPFHDDHSPSMSVSREKQMFKCFTCGVGGNVFSFVSKYENISFIEAVKKVADSEGIDLDISNLKKGPKINQKEYEIMDFATKIFQNNLNSKEGHEAKNYLKSRNINEEIIKTFKIGYALNDRSSLSKILLTKYDVNDLEKLGLVTKNGIDTYDKFIKRVMIPLTDINNQVVGYTGRIIDKSDPNQAKYINTKETIIYKKGNILFNYYNALDYIKQKKEVIIVEGNMDAIRLYASGIRNVIALMGTALTKEQIKIIKNLRSLVVLALDNDDAGDTATLKVGEELTKNNIQVKVVKMAGAKDPDEYIVKFGTDKFLDLIKHSPMYLDYKLNSLKSEKNLNNTEELVEYVSNVIKELANKDPITQEVTLKKLSVDYNLDYDVLKDELGKLNKPKVEEAIKKPQKVKKNKYELATNKIFVYLMSDAKYLKIFNSKLGYFQNKNERELLNEIEYYIKKNNKIDFANFISYIENYDNLKPMVNNIIDSMDFDELNEEVFVEYLKYVNEYLRLEDIKKIKERIKSEVDINKKVELTEELARLKKEV